MKTTDVDWKSGRVTYWKLDEIDGTRPLVDQPLVLDEDLAQVCYARGRVIDIGWYPMFSPHGQFGVVVVSNADWTHPLLEIRCKTVDELKAALSRAVAMAEDDSPDDAR